MKVYDKPCGELLHTYTVQIVARILQMWSSSVKVMTHNLIHLWRTRFLLHSKGKTPFAGVSAMAG